MYCTNCGHAVDVAGPSSRVGSRTVLYWLIGTFALVGLLAAALRVADTESPAEATSSAGDSAPMPSGVDVPALWKSVVTLVSLNAQGHPLTRGSGFVIDAQGTVATTWQIVERAASVQGVLHDGSHHPVVKLVNVDRDQNVALVRLGSPGAPPAAPMLRLGEDAAAVAGEPILTIGAPQPRQHTVSEGVLAQVHDLKYRRLFQLTAPVSSDSTGAPVLTRAGEVIAIVIGSVQSRDAPNLAAPVSIIRRLSFEASAAGTITLPPWPQRD